MTGETEEKPSSWTTDTLKSHITTLLEERDRRYRQEFSAQTDSLVSADKRYEQRFLAQEVAVQQALQAQEKAVAAALIASEKAVLKAEAATESRFSCVAADTPILCADLIWRKAGDLKVGDELIGCDEESLDAEGRRFQRAVVTDYELDNEALLVVSTIHGAVRCTPTHPWLVRYTGSRRPGTAVGQKVGVWHWVEAQFLQPGDLVMHALTPWEVDRSWEAGWLAGLFDGEGCLSVRKTKSAELSVSQNVARPGASSLMVLSQRESDTATRIGRSLKERFGDLFHVYTRNTDSRQHQPHMHFTVCKRPDILTVLGTVRPPRLLAKADQVWEDRKLGTHGCAVTVASIEDAGIGLIARMATSTKTYIANGFAAHNSVNEFRNTLADQATTFMPRVEAEQRVSQSAEKIEEVRDSMDDIRTVMGHLITRDVLDAVLVSTDRRFEAATKEIQGLRETRSANVGADAEEQRRRRQANWQIGLMVSGAITIAGIIVAVIVHFWH